VRSGWARRVQERGYTRGEWREVFLNRKGERWAKRGRRPTKPGLLKENERERRNRAGPKDRRLVWAKKRGGKERLRGRERES
jgi:hypothetical protein